MEYLICRRLLALSLAVTLVAPFPAWSAPSPLAQREIEQLLVYLEKSGCDFQRNGQWHDAHAAREHIETKYKALLQRNMVQNTEDFIANAATTSTVGGGAYQVRCAGVTQPAGMWMRAELARMRKAAALAPR